MTKNEATRSEPNSPVPEPARGGQPAREGAEEQAAPSEVAGIGEVLDSEPVQEGGAVFPNTWWGSYRVAPHQQGRWQVGPLTLWLQRLSYEWRLAVDNGSEQDFDPGQPVQIHAPTPIAALPEAITAHRYGFGRTVDTVRLSPMMADRAVVTKTEQPLYVFAGEEITIYVSFALWVRVAVGEPSRSLHEAPVFRLSDTWFGSNTMEGELCYASRATGRLEMTDMPRRPYRAIGAVKVRNHAGDALLIERLKTPCRLLSLYQDENGQLWTNTQVLERGQAGEVHYEVQHNPPEQAPGAKLLSGPRDHVHRTVFQRAFSSFVS